MPVYIAPYSQSPLTLSGVFLSFSRSPPFLCSRDRSLPSFILACFGTMRLRCANDRAADIGNYSLRNSRASLLLLLCLLLFLFLFVLSSPIVLACLSHLLLLFLDALSFILARTDMAKRAHSPLVKDCEAATSFCKCCYFCCVMIFITRLQI